MSQHNYNVTTAKARPWPALGVIDGNKEETHPEGQNNMKPALKVHGDGNNMESSEDIPLSEPNPTVERYCIQISVDQIAWKGKLPPPHYAWNEPLVCNIAQCWLACKVAEAGIMAPGEAILFIGCGTAAIGLMQD